MWLLLALCSCGERTPPRNLLPDTVAVVWRRTALENVPVGDAPDPVPRSSITFFQRGTYQGPGQIEVRIYRLTSSAVGLDLVQRWRPSADTVFFSQGEYFVVVKWQEAERTALHEFVRDLEKRLGSQGA